MPRAHEHHEIDRHTPARGAPATHGALARPTRRRVALPTALVLTLVVPLLACHGNPHASSLGEATARPTSGGPLGEATARPTAGGGSGKAPPRQDVVRPGDPPVALQVHVDDPVVPDPASDPWDWTGIVGTGQSLSVGYEGRPVLSTTRSFNNLKLVDDGPDPKFATAKNLDVGALVEPIRPLSETFSGPHYTPGLYPANIGGETVHWGMGSELTTLARRMGLPDLVSVHTEVGESGSPISGIAKGTPRSYERALFETRAIARIAGARRLRFGVGGVVLTHGEADWDLPDYEAQLLRLAVDYDADLRAITGQKQKVPMFVSQQHSFPARGEAGPPRALSTLAAWTAATKRPDLVSCIGPKYQYAYRDTVHLEPASSRRLGIKLAEAMAQELLAGKKFRPVEPTSATRAGNVVTVSFHVPNPPLVWDGVLPKPHPEPGHPWAAGKGFELEDATGPLRIGSARIVGSAVEITLAESPRGPMVVRYAMTMDATGPEGPRGGEADGRMGLLRDSDPLIGVDDEELTVTFEHGSPWVEGDFSGHTTHDLVVADGVPPETAIKWRFENIRVELNKPWTGPSGVRKVHVHSNQYNYAVAFELPVQ